LQNELVDQWTETGLDRGSVGFIEEHGEKAPVHMIRISCRDDTPSQTAISMMRAIEQVGLRFWTALLRPFERLL
jgi:hypothetical protein